MTLRTTMQFIIRKATQSVLFAFILTCGIFLISGSALYGQDVNETTSAIEEGETITLPQALRIALANNRDIKRSLLTVEEAETQVTTAWSNVIPRISTSMSYTRNVEVPVFFIPADFTDPSSPLVPVRTGTDNNWNGNIAVTQTLFRGEAIVGISSAALYRQVQSESFRTTAQQIVTQTRLAYYQVLIAEERFQLQQATVNRLEKNLEQNRSRYRAGLLDEYDVLQLEVQLANERPTLQEARYAIQQAYRNLALNLGVPVQYDFQVEGNLREYDIGTSSASTQENSTLKEIDEMSPLILEPDQSFLEQAFNSRGDLRTLDAQLQLKNREILGIWAQYLPSISATYNIQWNANESGDPDFFGTEQQRARSQSVALNISFPLFQGFQRNANLARAKIQKKSLTIQQNNSRQQARNAIASARESLQQALETSDARERAIEQAQRGYEIALTRLDNGVGSQLDVTNAEVQLQQAELNYAQNVFNYLTAKAQYDQAIGQVPFVERDNSQLMENIGTEIQ